MSPRNVPAGGGTSAGPRCELGVQANLHGPGPYSGCPETTIARATKNCKGDILIFKLLFIYLKNNRRL